MTGKGLTQYLHGFYKDVKICRWTGIFVFFLFNLLKKREEKP